MLSFGPVLLIFLSRGLENPGTQFNNNNPWWLVTAVTHSLSHLRACFSSSGSKDGRTWLPSYCYFFHHEPAVGMNSDRMVEAGVISDKARTFWHHTATYTHTHTDTVTVTQVPRQDQFDICLAEKLNWVIPSSSNCLVLWCRCAPLWSLFCGANFDAGVVMGDAFY